MIGNSLSPSGGPFLRSPITPPHDPLIGSRLGPYRIEEFLGAGGMGSVYLGIDEALQRPAAIKTLSRVEQRDVVRFLDEARRQARLDHPHVVSVYGVGSVTGGRGPDIHYIALKYIEGSSLAQWVRSHGPLDPADATQLILDSARGLYYVHSEGFIHRDVKPSNILIDIGDRALISDFGIAFDPGGSESGSHEFVGTWNYASPEQVARQPLDVRSDIYSLGLTWLYALTARDPIEDTRSDELPIIDPAFPKSVRNTLERMLALDPQHRFASMLHCIEQLERTQDLLQARQDRADCGVGGERPSRKSRRRHRSYKWLTAGVAALFVAPSLPIERIRSLAFLSPLSPASPSAASPSPAAFSSSAIEPPVAAHGSTPKSDVELSVGVEPRPSDRLAPGVTAPNEIPSHRSDTEPSNVASLPARPPRATPAETPAVDLGSDDSLPRTAQLLGQIDAASQALEEVVSQCEQLVADGRHVSATRLTERLDPVVLPAPQETPRQQLRRVLSDLGQLDQLALRDNDLVARRQLDETAFRIAPRLARIMGTAEEGPFIECARTWHLDRRLVSNVEYFAFLDDQRQRLVPYEIFQPGQADHSTWIACVDRNRHRRPRFDHALEPVIALHRSGMDLYAEYVGKRIPTREEWLDFVFPHLLSTSGGDTASDTFECVLWDSEIYYAFIGRGQARFRQRDSVRGGREGFRLIRVQTPVTER